MSWTIADLLKIPLDEVPIQEPIEGEVKLAKPIAVHEKYGESQFFVLKDATGEIAVAWQAGKPEVHLAAVEVGDRVRICAELYNKKMVGARKETYTKDGTKKAKVVVYREKLKNLSRTASAPAAPAASPSTARPPQASPSSAILTEAEAIDFYLRVSSTVESDAACVLLEAALNGRLRMPATSHATTAASSSTSNNPPDDAPPWGDDEIPF